MNFKIGEKAVHKTHGVGMIRGIESRNFGGITQDFYLLQIMATGIVVRFPKSPRQEVVRGLLTHNEMSKVYNILRKPRRISKTVWNRRFKEFNEKIRSGSICEIAEVMRDLVTLSNQKELSFGEKEMLKEARLRIVHEISAARSCTEQEVEQTIDRVILGELVS